MSICKGDTEATCLLLARHKLERWPGCGLAVAFLGVPVWPISCNLHCKQPYDASTTACAILCVCGPHQCHKDAPQRKAFGSLDFETGQPDLPPKPFLPSSRHLRFEQTVPQESPQVVRASLVLCSTSRCLEHTHFGNHLLQQSHRDRGNRKQQKL